MRRRIVMGVAVLPLAGALLVGCGKVTVDTQTDQAKHDLKAQHIPVGSVRAYDGDKAASSFVEVKNFQGRTPIQVIDGQWQLVCFDRRGCASVELEAQQGLQLLQEVSCRLRGLGLPHQLVAFAAHWPSAKSPPMYNSDFVASCIGGLAFVIEPKT
jgi:hypothetical protein